MIGVFFVIVNWMIVYNAYVKNKHSSWVPLLGGLFVAIGLSALPYESIQNYLWVPFIIDYGCLPALIHMSWLFIIGSHKKKE